MLFGGAANIILPARKVSLGVKLFQEFANTSTVQGYSVQISGGVTTERDDLVRVRCIVRASRKGPLRARSNDRAASSGEGRSYARRAETS